MEVPTFEKYSIRAGLSKAEAQSKQIKDTYLTNMMYYIEEGMRAPYYLKWVNGESHKSLKNFVRSKPGFKEPKFSEMESKFNKTYTVAEREAKRRVFEDNMRRLPVATRYSDMTP
jgi:hypothetical protein